MVFLPRLLNPFLAPLMLNFARAIGGTDNVWGLPGNLTEAQVGATEFSGQNPIYFPSYACHLCF